MLVESPGILSRKGMKRMQENPPIYLQENLRFLRKQFDMSQEELAQKIGLNRGNIASYEKGIAEPKICNLLKISYVFGVSPLDLMEKDLSKSAPVNYTNGTQNGFRSISDHDKQTLSYYLSKADELQTVVSSLYNCHCFKIKNIDAQDRNTQVLVSNFEQLYEITHTLLHSYKELLDLVHGKVDGEQQNP